MSKTEAKTAGFRLRLRALRKSRGLSMHQLGRKAKLSQPAIGGYEAGTNCPSIEVVERLADVLCVSPAWLAYGIGAASEETPVAAAQEAL